MSRLPVRSHDIKSLLPPEIREIPFKGRVADCLGLFGLLVIVLGLISFLLSGDSLPIQYSGLGLMTVQGACYLQSFGFLLLGTGQLLFLRKKLPVLLHKKVRLFSREGWYYIGVLSTLVFLLLFLLYLFIDSSHLSMAAISLCAFLLPFTVLNAWETVRDGKALAAERKRILERAALVCGVSLLLLIGLTSLTGRQTAVVRPNSERPPGRSAVRESGYEEASLVLNAYTSHLLELDARFIRLMRKDTAANPAGVARVREEIKAQEYALGHLLDSLDSRRKELSPLTTSFRSLLNGHRILSGFQTEQQSQSGQQPDPQSQSDWQTQRDSIRDLSSLP
jgi:hypothetical protein